MPSIIRATTTSGLQVAPDNSGSLQLQTNGTTTAVTIDTSQNVGIGTSSPSAKLHVSGISLGNSNIRLTNTFTNGRSWELNPYASGVSDVPFTIRDVTAGADRVTIDSSGRVTIPNQPAFFARKTNGGAMAPVNPVLFNDVVTNIGSYYNASTGRFTAPVAGNYYFISIAHAETTNNLARALTFSKNGAQVSYAYILNATGGRARIVNVSILTLAANDYITVATDTSDFWAGDSSGINFSGYLIG